MNNMNNNYFSSDVFLVKKQHLVGWLMMKGFKLKRMPPDEKNPKFNVFIFNNSEQLQEAITDYFKLY